MYFLVEIKRSLVKAVSVNFSGVVRRKNREFDEKGYMEYNVTILIRMTVVNITLTLHYLI